MAAFAALTAAVGYSQEAPPLSAPPAQATDKPKDTGEEAIKLQDFVVTDDADSGYATSNAIGSTRTNEAIIDTAQVINVINQNMMQDYQPGELADILKYVPGVTIESNVGDSAMIRGFTVRNQYTDGMVDNQNQSQAGADPFQYERIEVIKGPEGLVYGSTAIGGVTNRIRKKPNWKPRTEIAFTYGNHNQTKTELDTNIPLTDKLSFRLLAMYRNENLVNGVATRFAYFDRWIANPSMMWKVTPKSQLYIYGEFLGEHGYKHWGENGMFVAPAYYVAGKTTAAVAAGYPYLGKETAQFGVPWQDGGITTWGLLPRDFTFGGPQSHSINHKDASGIFYEMNPMENWLIRAGGTVSWWNHYVEDVIPVNMASDNVDMTRLWRTLANDDFYAVYAVDSTATFRLLGMDHRLFSVFQYQYTGDYQDGWTQNPSRPIPDLNIYNPVYTYYDPYDKVHNSNQYVAGNNYSGGFKDHIKLFGDKLQLAGGPRYDWYNSRTNNTLPVVHVEGVTNKQTAWTYNYGALLKPFGNNFSLFYGHSENYQPNYGQQPDGTPYPAQTGLDNEEGIKMAFLQGRITGTVSNYVIKQVHILLPDPDPTRATLGYKIDSGLNETKGQEADVFFQITHELSYSVGGAVMNYVTTTNNIAPRGAPTKTANSTLRYGIKEGYLKGLSFGGGFTYKSAFNVETATATQPAARYYLPGYHTFDAWTGYHWKNYAFQLNCSNVGNTWYLQRSTSKDQIWEGPERLIKFRVSRVF